MPLTIETKGKKRLVSWSMDGDEVFPSMPATDVSVLQADGRELEIILNSFDGIPRTTSASQVWVGLFAQQIVANLAPILAGNRRNGNAAIAPVED